MGAKRDATGGVRGGQGRLPMTEENCENCRYWSELVVKCQGAGYEIQALCLNQKGPFHARYRDAGQWCHTWADGADGAVDDPDLPPGAYGEAAVKR
jgi:hypothetical protein